MLKNNVAIWTKKVNQRNVAYLKIIGTSLAEMVNKLD